MIAGRIWVLSISWNSGAWILHSGEATIANQHLDVFTRMGCDQPIRSCKLSIQFFAVKKINLI